MFIFLHLDVQQRGGDVCVREREGGLDHVQISE